MSTLRLIPSLFAGLLLGLAPAAAQQPPDAPVTTVAVDQSANTPKQWAALSDLLRVTTNALKKQEWPDAALGLQQLLDVSPGVLVPVPRRWADGKETTHWLSPHTVADAQLAALPPPGLAAYRKHAGPQADALFKKARQQKDAALLAQVARRFAHTDAGREALLLLAEAHAGKGRRLEAALCLDQALRRPPAAKAEADLLHRTAAAYRRAGDKANADRLVRRLQVLLQKEPVKLKDLEVELERIKIATGDWPLFRGNAARNGYGPAGVPKVKAQQWARPTMMDRMDRGDDPDPSPRAAEWLKKALANLQKNNGFLAPSASPIVVGNQVAYLTYCGITAATLREYRDGNVVIKPGEIWWKSTPFESSLGILMIPDGKNLVRPIVDNWLTAYDKDGRSPVVFENEQIGALSTDHKFVFSVDDLAVPVPPAFLSNNVRTTPDQYSEDIKPRVFWNNLQAFELDTGKLAWRLGQGFEPRNIDKKDPFHESHFLGAPLPLADKLYVLNEKNDGTLRLVCVDPARGEALSVQPLATVQEKFFADPNRRTQACHLAYQDGVLVCPTNAGVLLGVDLATQTVLWMHGYRPTGETKPEKLTFRRPTWRASAPVLHAGAVIYAGPDDDAVHCLDLRDGKPRWRVKRDGAHYVAGVHGGRVLLVGRDHCRALSLQDGSEVWKLAIDEPTGLGVLGADGLCTLPVRGKTVALWTIDLGRGQVVARQALPQTELLGNLVIHGGRLLSQSATKVRAFPLAR